MKTLMARNIGRVIFLSCLTARIAAQGQTFETVLVFDGTNGNSPQFMSFAQGTDGNLYGTTPFGGVNGAGTVFKLSRGGLQTILYSFSAAKNLSDGGEPLAGLTLGTDGNFYGMTSVFGDSICSCGTVFKISPSGALTTLHRFQGSDGAFPYSMLIQGFDGNFYGTTNSGGGHGLGTIFRITPRGKFTTLHNFNGPDGGNPYTGLIAATDGNYYGATIGGGSNNCSSSNIGCGTVYRITPSGTLSTLHRFCATDCSDGYFPSGLLQAVDGNFYGTTGVGGDPGCDAPYGCGTVFRIAPDGMLTTLHDFEFTDGAGPSVPGLIQANDGNLYGTTYGGGLSTCIRTGAGCGTAFEVTPAGLLTTLHTFCQLSGNCPDGLSPDGGVFQSSSGTFYGATEFGGGSYNDGTIFALSTGLGPFVAFVQSATKANQNVGVLGQGFTGTSKVELNGTPMNFKVVSETFLQATVPKGSTSGYVTVTTPIGTLTSDKPLRVIP